MNGRIAGRQKYAHQFELAETEEQPTLVRESSLRVHK